MISVSKDVAEHIPYRQTKGQLQLDYIPIYNMPLGLKCSFLNTKSLHKSIKIMSTNHHLCTSDLIYLAEVKLLKTGYSNEYAVEEFNEIFRNDQTWNSIGRPPH